MVEVLLLLAISNYYAFYKSAQYYIPFNVRQRTRHEISR